MVVIALVASLLRGWCCLHKLLSCKATKSRHFVTQHEGVICSVRASKGFWLFFLQDCGFQLVQVLLHLTDLSLVTCYSLLKHQVWLNRGLVFLIATRRHSPLRRLSLVVRITRTTDLIGSRRLYLSLILSYVPLELFRHVLLDCLRHLAIIKRAVNFSVQLVGWF